MPTRGRYRKILLRSALVASATVLIASCSSPDSTAESTIDQSTSQDSASADSVNISLDTPVGQESQRIVDILNADEDTTTEQWAETLHSSFTAEVSVEELVDLLNHNIRPAQPFTVTQYEGQDRQAVTTLTSATSAPVDMTVALDSEGSIIGLFFGENMPES